jgi:hypothetical protein
MDCLICRRIALIERAMSFWAIIKDSRATRCFYASAMPLSCMTLITVLS